MLSEGEVSGELPAKQKADEKAKKQDVQGKENARVI